jgi:F420-dependent oxidoreductase-like protein
MRIALMIEGQEGVGWEDWLSLARACEEHSFEALFRSDHYYTDETAGVGGALDAWATLAALAARTSTLRLGTLVSPVTFRHPSILAKSAVTVDHVSGGRVELGLGTGWMQSEHERYGFPFPPLGTRMQMLEEQLEIVGRQFTENQFIFDGRHYRVEELDARPKPVQRPRLPIIVGGRARKRTAHLAARFADEYNTLAASPEEIRRRHVALAHACEREGRDPGTLHYSMMIGFVTGADRPGVREHSRRLAEWRGENVDPDEQLSRFGDSWLVGTTEELVERLREYEEAGVERVMLQHLLHRDLDLVELIGREVLRHLAS